MTQTFDHMDMNSWYFKDLSRADATQMLMNEKESGIFLVRDSNTIQGDFVLCVREDERVSHYIINRVLHGDGSIKYRIGDQMFNNMPSLLEFYKLHYLDTTPLVRPLVAAPPVNVLETVQAKFDFRGNDTDDLPFMRGEILEVINKDEEQWWTARNKNGNVGSIPVPYVMRYVETNANSNNLGSADRPNQMPQDEQNSRANVQASLSQPGFQRALPARARVRQSRVPNAYDKTALRLDRGDIVTVTKTNINGQWEGITEDGRRGHFPFTHVEFLDEPNALNNLPNIPHTSNGS